MASAWCGRPNEANPQESPKTQLEYQSPLIYNPPHQLLPVRLSVKIRVSLNKSESAYVTPAIYFHCSETLGEDR